MLHEILLALSGHPSPLFEQGHQPEGTHVSYASPFLSPSERALLRTIGRLAELHRQLRERIDKITTRHPSTVCRAVATSIQQTHLPRFQQKILQVESKILTRDAALVGAYDIVPLAGVVEEFDDWHRRMAWYVELACFMKPDRANGSMPGECSGASLIDKLGGEQQTGYPDIEAVAVELVKVAEAAWLRQLASWLLYGTLPSFGADDFFIRSRVSADHTEPQFRQQAELLPSFVSGRTAASVLFIGKSLHQVRRQIQSLTSLGKGALDEDELVAAHLKLLSGLTLPLVATQLSRTVSEMRLSLSRNMLQHLLPLEKILEVLSCFRQFFLLGRGEFAAAIIQEADGRFHAPKQHAGKPQRDLAKALSSLSFSEAEVQQTLSAAFKALLCKDDDLEDELLEFARLYISLSPPPDAESRPSTPRTPVDSTLDHAIDFKDLIFPNAISLGFHIAPPLDLFVSQREIRSYAAINAYLLSIRRADLRLSELWRRTAARRDFSSAPTGAANRVRIKKRRVATRRVWATCSAALLLLSETSAFFEGEIIRESWSTFEQWVKTPVGPRSDGKYPLRSSTGPDYASQQDPETLASGHRIFLASLTYALLLTDDRYTRELRSLLGNVDSLIAFFGCLLDMQHKLDLEHDAGGETAYTVREEQRISSELDRSRKRVDGDLKAVVARLRHLDQERIGSGRYLDPGPTECGFSAWKGGGVDRLLMKLEFGRMTSDGFV